MSRNRKRTNGRAGQRLAYAATTRTLGQLPQRNRRTDRPVRQDSALSEDHPRSYAADIARILADADHPTIRRQILRDAMPDLGQRVEARRGAAGRRATIRLSEMLAGWERLGWVRRNPDDTVTVLDRAALRARADRLDPLPYSEETTQPGSRPAGVIARALADALAAGDRETAAELTGELQAAEDHDPQRLATWARAIRSRLAAGATGVHRQITEDGEIPTEEAR